MTFLLGAALVLLGYVVGCIDECRHLVARTEPERELVKSEVHVRMLVRGAGWIDLAFESEGNGKLFALSAVLTARRMLGTARVIN